MAKSASCPQAAIANATSLAEVERLKGMLQSGQIPGRESRQGNAQEAPLLVCVCLFIYLSFIFVLCSSGRVDGKTQSTTGAFSGHFSPCHFAT